VIESCQRLFYSPAMKCPVSLLVFSLLLLGGLLPCGCGCDPREPDQLAEEKEAFFMAGKNRLKSLDYRGAIASFEKALEINPKSAAAHFELGILFDQRENDPAAAVYHYNNYLKYRPNAGNADIVRQHILACKQELARTVSFGAVTEKQQRELEKLIEDNKKLVEENKRLAEENTQWKVFAAALPVPRTNPPAISPKSPRTGPGTPDGSGARSGAGAGQPKGTDGSRSGYTSPSPYRSPVRPPVPYRNHAVRSGETMNSVARQYGVRLETLKAANPGVDPRRLRAGQVLKIP
jgi:LysM repeat protein